MLDLVLFSLLTALGGASVVHYFLVLFHPGAEGVEEETRMGWCVMMSLFGTIISFAAGLFSPFYFFPAFLTFSALSGAAGMGKEVKTPEKGERVRKREVRMKKVSREDVLVRDLLLVLSKMKEEVKEGRRKRREERRRKKREEKKKEEKVEEEEKKPGIEEMILKELEETGGIEELEGEEGVEEGEESLEAILKEDQEEEQ